MKKSMVVVGLALVLFGVVATVQSVKADWQIDSKGNLVEMKNVLGDTAGGEGDQQTPEPTQTAEPKDTPEPTDTPEAQQMQEKNQEQNQVQSKFEVENKDGKLVVKTHTVDKSGKEVQTETQLKAGEALQVEAQTNTGNHFAINTEDNSGLTVTNGGKTAQSALPLSVNAQNQLVVTTTAGQKVVTVLPDQAVKNLLSSGVLSSITESPVASAPGSTSSVGQLSAVGNTPTYTISGTKQVRFLGLFPVTLNRQVQVSAENGTVVNTAQSAIANFVSLFSF